MNYLGEWDFKDYLWLVLRYTASSIRFASFFAASFRFLYFLLHCSVIFKFLNFFYEHVCIEPGLPGDRRRIEVYV